MSRPIRHCSSQATHLTRCALLALVVLLCASWSAAMAQEAAGPAASPDQEPVVVGVYVSPPFVIQSGDSYSGMAIQLWEGMAEEVGLEFRYQPYATLGELVAATATGAIDVSVTNLTITRARADHIEFTHPWFDAGMRVMVHDNAGAGFASLVRGLADLGYLRAYAWIAGVIIAATILLTLFDRHFDKAFPRRWRDGLAESFYSVMSVATSGKPAARKNLFGWAGRVWQALWLLCGVAVLAFVTSTVTSVMTTLSLTSQIHDLSDLAGRQVGVLQGSVSEDYARSLGLQVRGFANVDAAAAALTADRIAGIIADAPVLEYFAHQNPELAVNVVGPIFEPDKYGFGLPIGSALTHPVDVALIGAQEAGRVAALKDLYFAD